MIDVVRSEGKTPSLSISATDFGPISEAAVSLSPLTVFVGPSDSGKSYLSILLYVLHNVFHHFPHNLYGTQQRDVSWTLYDRSWNRSDKFIELVSDWSERLSSEGQRARIPTELSNYFRTAIQGTEQLNTAVETELRRCFGLQNVVDLIRVGSEMSHSRFELSANCPTDESCLHYEFSLGSDSVQVSGRIPNSLPLRDSDKEFLQLYAQSSHDPAIPSLLLAHRTFEKICSSWFAPISEAYYLPADRAGVMHSHQAIVSTMIQSAPIAGIRSHPSVPLLSGVLADFLSNLVEMTEKSGYRRRRSRSGQQLASSIESEILKGKIWTDRTEAISPHFSFRPSGWSDTLPLQRTSSMVSELAPVALFLRHMVHPGDLLIIEEPEAHLHPAKQADLMVVLATLVRTGIRLLITTHSDWILEKLANLVSLSKLPDSERSKVVDYNCALQPEEVGVWLFHHRDEPDGVSVKKLELDPDLTLYPSDWDDVREALYNEGAQIHNQLEDINQQ